MTFRDTVNDYTHTFNMENELVSVSNNGNTTSFAYDAAGIRTKTVAPNGTVTDYPFPGYEVESPTSNPTVRITFSIAGQAVALKVIGSSSNTYYLYNDHLGSTSTMSTTAGGTVSGSTARYYPFGGWRTEPTAGLTDPGFTGHLHNNLGSGADNLRLVYMQARWYLPALGRFISADTLVPDPANPQGYNRYSYVENRPLLFKDPTGHISCTDPHLPGEDQQACQATQPPPTQPFTSPFFNFTGGLTLAEMQMAHQAASDIAQRMAQEMGGLSAQEAFLSVFGGPITLSNVDKYLVDAAGFSVYAIASQTEALITVGIKEITNHYLFIHEIFHLLDIVVLGGAANQALWDDQRAPGSTFPNRPNLDGPSDEWWGFAGGNFSEWQKSRSGASGEEFADMGIGWTYNQWDSSTKGLTRAGQARADFMNVNMAIWLTERIP